MSIHAEADVSQTEAKLKRLFTQKSALSNQLASAEHSASEPARGEFETKQEFETRIRKAEASARGAIEKQIAELDAQGDELSKGLTELQQAKVQAQAQLAASPAWAGPVQMLVKASMERFDLDQQTVPSFTPNSTPEQQAGTNTKAFRFKGQIAGVRVDTDTAKTMRQASDAGRLYVLCSARPAMPTRFSGKYLVKRSPAELTTAKKEEAQRHRDSLGDKSKGVALTVIATLTGSEFPSGSRPLGDLFEGPAEVSIDKEVPQEIITIEWTGEAQPQTVFVLEAGTRKLNKVWAK